MNETRYEFRVVVRWTAYEAWMPTDQIFWNIATAESYGRVLGRSHHEVETKVQRRPVVKWEDVG